jgi:hypothetical protein
MLINHYELEYYGTKFWADEQTALAEAAAFLQSRGVGEPAAWDVVEMDESVMKLCNVKLKNNPANVLYLDEQSKPAVEKRQSPTA